jgi:hypothetical protein
VRSKLCVPGVSFPTTDVGVGVGVAVVVAVAVAVGVGRVVVVADGVEVGDPVAVGVGAIVGSGSVGEGSAAGLVSVAAGPASVGSVTSVAPVALTTEGADKLVDAKATGTPIAPANRPAVTTAEAAETQGDLMTGRPESRR